MMPTDRFERQLPQLLNELAEPRTPGYLDDLLWQTAHTSQRPAWSLLERWLPMLDIARQPVVAPPVPWRSIGLGIALIALLVAMVAALAIGSRKPFPAPFGPATNGVVAYAANGDIYTADPISGTSNAVLAGPETDADPIWSLDGRRFAFERKAEGDRGPGHIYVASADGSNPVRITTDPMLRIFSYSFSPDGSMVAIAASPEGAPRIFLAAADGSGIRQLDLSGPATHASWRPPDGMELLFMDNGNDTQGYGGIYAVDVATGEVRTILAKDSYYHRAAARWSPDGTEISYVEWFDDAELTVQTHVMSVDGSNHRILPVPNGAVWQLAVSSWSNDGTRVLAIRGYTGGWRESVAVALPVDGTSLGTEIAFPGDISPACCSVWEWAPDDSFILGSPIDVLARPLDQVLLDPVRGTSTALPWNSSSHPTWQRLAR